jgi:hypothetical protein
MEVREPGLRGELQELILRLKSGGVAGKTGDPRIAQAKRYFDLGIGRELGLADFAAYLATIPEIPEALRTDDPDFPHLVLVEPRLPLAKLCALGNIEFHGDDNTFEPRDAQCRNPRHPVWIRIQDGRKNRDRSVDDCRRNFAAGELGLTALQGVAAYLQHPEVVADLARGSDGHAMDLPGSVGRGGRGGAACLGVRDGRAKLGWNWGGSAGPGFGSASRRSA